MKTTRDVMQTIDGTKYLFDFLSGGLWFMGNKGWWHEVKDWNLKVYIVFKMGYVPKLPEKKTINQKLMDAF